MCRGRLLQLGGRGVTFPSQTERQQPSLAGPHGPPGRRESCQGSWFKCKPRTSEMKPGSRTRAPGAGPRAAPWGNPLSAPPGRGLRAGGRSSLLHAPGAGFRAATRPRASRQPGGRRSALLSAAPGFGFAWTGALNPVIAGNVRCRVPEVVPSGSPWLTYRCGRWDAAVIGGSVFDLELT